jgi:triosephosphate isomerase
MRRPIIAGNWKMHLLRSEAVALAEALKRALKDVHNVEIVVAPPYTALPAVAEALSGSTIALAAQNVHWESFGAYTGEIAPKMLKDVGCRHVIVGHSERRQYFGEDDSTVNRKVKAVLSEGLQPIVCIGETLDQRRRGETLAIIEQQVKEALSGIPEDSLKAMVIAYEPVWAIGTGETATPEQAEEVHSRIRSILRRLYSEGSAQQMRIQYGGSVKPENIKELMAEEDIDGALVGGASLKAESFIKIVRFEDRG